ncbi:MAG: FHA domain-containing protein [Spirochaetota bacterium]
MGDTIFSHSNIGKRLKNFKKKEHLGLSYQGKNYPIVGQITIGRSRTNDIRLDDPLVSRRHAMVQKIKDAYFIKDLDSTNGTYVNKTRVPQGKWVKLHRNDIVLVGRVEMKIW